MLTVASSHACLLADPAREDPDGSAVGVVVADSQVAAREGTCAILRQERGLRVMACCAALRDTLEVVRSRSPRVVVADPVHQDIGGLGIIDIVRKLSPGTAVMLYTLMTDAAVARACVESGAAGVLDKRAPASELVGAVLTVAAGKRHVPAEWLPLAGQAADHPSALHTQVADLLSAAELDVLQLIGQGLDTPAIAARLARSAKTIETHRSQIQTKLGLASPTKLAQLAWRLTDD